jgi:hypothetical protein
MKPNTDELCALMTKCLSNDKLSISNRSHVTRILSKYSALGVSPVNSNIEITELVSDMRVLGSSLLTLMNAKSNRPTSAEFRKRNRCVVGKHLLVSMGRHGVLWIGPSSVLGKDADMAITDHISSKHLRSSSSLFSTGAEEVINTSGAGDSFCAGVISGLLSSDGKGIGPSLSSVMSGMKFAEKSLKSVSAIPKS